jgi:hypothetical protein
MPLTDDPNVNGSGCSPTNRVLPDRRITAREVAAYFNHEVLENRVT